MIALEDELAPRRPTVAENSGLLIAPLAAATAAKLQTDMIMKGIPNAPAKGVPVTHPLMHRMRSLDDAAILLGEIEMILDDGSAHLKQGCTSRRTCRF